MSHLPPFEHDKCQFADHVDDVWRNDHEAWSDREVPPKGLLLHKGAEYQNMYEYVKYFTDFHE